MEGSRIGIAGAGIGGLAAASLLADQGHRVVVFDQFATPRPVGSGLIVQPVGLEVLDRLGVGAGARRLGAPIRRLRGAECRTGRAVLDVTYGDGPGAESLAIHRASLFSVLHEAALRRGVVIEGGRRVTGRIGPCLAFAEGARSEPFDLLIDASGAGSVLSPLRARGLAYGALWGVVDWVPVANIPPDELTQRYRRADRMIGVLPIGCLPGDPLPKAAVFWSLPREGHAAWLAAGLAAWKEEARRLWPEAMAFLDQITDPEQMTMARYGHGAMRRPYAEGIAFLGDAAHRASPQLGQGANMALLDALTLALALGHFDRRTELGEALRLYAAARRWHVRAYQTLSALFTPQYQSDSRALPVVRDRVLYPLSRVPPLPWILSALVSGRLLPPLGRLASLAGERPEAIIARPLPHPRATPMRSP